jgi:hypothetical protein
LLRKTSGSLRAHYSLLRSAIRGDREGNFDRTMPLRSVRNYSNMRGSRAVLLFNYSSGNNCTALRPYLLEKGRRK